MIKVKKKKHQGYTENITEQRRKKFEEIEKRSTDKEEKLNNG